MKASIKGVLAPALLMAAPIVWAEAATDKVQTKAIEDRVAVRTLLDFFDDMDCDSRNVIDIGEIEEHWHTIFPQLDHDRSRTLDAVEFQAVAPGAPPWMLEHMMQRVDRNGDGLVGPRELESHFYIFYERLDRPADGDLTREELLELARRFGVERP